MIKAQGYTPLSLITHITILVLWVFFYLVPINVDPEPVPYEGLKWEEEYAEW